MQGGVEWVGRCEEVGRRKGRLPMVHVSEGWVADQSTAIRESGSARNRLTFSIAGVPQACRRCGSSRKRASNALA